MEMQSINTLLYGTALYPNERALRNQLETNWSPELTEVCRHDFIDDVPDYHLWLEAVRHLDEKRRREVVTQRQIMEDMFRDRTRRRDPRNPPLAVTDKCVPGTTPTIMTTTTATNSTPFISLPTLTEAEREILKHNSGCFKCRQVLVNHGTATCPNGFLPGAGYRSITEATVTAAKNRSIGAIIPAGAEGGNTPTTGTTMVAAVIPSVSAVLGDGTYSEGEEYVAPLHTPHLFWDCLLDGPGLPSPIQTRALIDSGSQAVIIDSKLVDQLAL